jgi:hypothetical protein
MGIANLQTSTKIFAHGDPANDGTVRSGSLHTSTFIGSVLTQGIGGREVFSPSYSPHSRDSLTGMGPVQNWGSGGNSGWRE